MPQCVIIADDLTGANATGVLLKKLNLKTTTIMNMEGMDREALSKYDAVTYPTESRAIESREAYQRVYDAVERLKSPDVKLYNKRIDSTLRGNLGAEIDGMLDSLNDNRIAIVVPCFPQAGRIAVGGYLLVNGVMLQKTDAARDPKTPIHTSVIESLVKEQTKYGVKSIFLDTVYQGIEALRTAVTEAVKEGNRVLVIDALQVEDLDAIAEALVESSLAYITVDPGPFTAAVARKVAAPQEQQGEEKKILMSIGSVTNLTKTQLEEVTRSYNTYTAVINTDLLIYAEAQREEEIRRVVNDVLTHQHESDLFCVVTSSVRPEFRLDLEKIAQELKTTEEELSLRINNAIAEISHRILKALPAFQGVFSSGGDITVAICRKLNSSGMELLHEVIPLAAYGTLVSGTYPGLKIVTKGGMVGGPDGMKQCIQFLKEQLHVLFL